MANGSQRRLLRGGVRRHRHWIQLRGQSGARKGAGRRWRGCFRYTRHSRLVARCSNVAAAQATVAAMQRRKCRIRSASCQCRVFFSNSLIRFRFLRIRVSCIMCGLPSRCFRFASGSLEFCLAMSGLSASRSMPSCDARVMGYCTMEETSGAG